MIFSKFFKAKWQHKDSNVRVTAIAQELSPQNAEQLAILNELINQDESDNVRKAALLKVDQLTTWLAATQDNRSNIKSFAQKYIEKQLVEQNDSVSTEFKKQFLERAPKVFLENWLFQESQLLLLKAIYQKLDKPQLAVSLFTHKQDEQFQQFLLTNINEQSLLEKLAKKTTIPTVKSEISSKLQQLIDAKEKPIQLTKDAQLILSKLLALKDIVDYEQVLSKRALLITQWEQAQSDFHFLSEEQQSIFNEKYVAIEQQLDKAFVQKAELHQQAQIIKQLAQDKANAREQFDAEFERLTKQLTDAVFENSELDEIKFSASLITLTKQVEASVLANDEKAQFHQKIMHQGNKLKQLPVIAQSVTDATHLISRISQLSLPTSLADMNERYEVYQTWLQEWQQVEKQSNGVLPDSIKNAKQEITSQWQLGLKPLFAKQKEKFELARKNIIDLKRLIANGKFNPCFGIYKKLQSNFTVLSVKQQQRLQRDYDLLTEKVAELSDWEHYIATPRKQELLTSIKALIEVPLDNPNEQANKVKAFRQQWNSLGHADDDVEQALNEEFNAACEQAFAPCRQFYAEQEKLRTQNATNRTQIIEKVNALAEQLAAPEINWKALDGQMNKLTQAWREAGEVDRVLYRKLQSQYKNALQPIKAAIADFQLQNSELKQGLINTAENLLATDNVFNAIEQIKTLQQQWREIGYAGPKQDNALWQRFREVNDEIFNKREAVKTQQHAAQDALKIEYDQQLVVLQEQFTQANSLALLQTLLPLVDNLQHSIKRHKPVLKGAINQIDKLMINVNKRIVALKQEKQQQSWFILFNLLEQSVDETIDITVQPDYKELSNFWQKKLSDAMKSNNNGDRVEKTLALEILAGVESPKDFSAQRLALQVSLMQQQMVSGEEIDLKALFIEWLQLGKLTKNDLPLISRIKPIYC